MGHGILTGDKLLKPLAGIFKHLSRKHDIVCRYGGEELWGLRSETGLSTAVMGAESASGINQECHRLTVISGGSEAQANNGEGRGSLFGRTNERPRNRLELGLSTKPSGLSVHLRSLFSLFLECFFTRGHVYFLELKS